MTAYVFLAEGFEEVEALTPVDILRRGGVTVKTVGIGTNTFCETHLWLIRHFQAVGHVASETDVENCCAYAMILNNVDHLTHQRSGLPQECTARLQYQF